MEDEENPLQQELSSMGQVQFDKIAISPIQNSNISDSNYNFSVPSLTHLLPFPSSPSEPQLPERLERDKATTRTIL